MSSRREVLAAFIRSQASLTDSKPPVPGPGKVELNHAEALEVAALLEALPATDPTISELERARIDAAKDNTKVTPEQILRLALDDLRRGDVMADACLVYLIKKPAGGECGTRSVYRSNIDRPDEVAYLEYFKLRTLEDWRDS